MREITNDSGTFWIDEEGALRKFQCGERNFYFPLSNRSYRNEKHLNWLEIPEGVTSLPAGSFDGYMVFTQIRFPESLRALGDATGGVFRHCSYSGILELPKNITYVAEDSFFLSSLGTIRISQDMEPRAVQKLVWLLRNHTYHYFLFYPMDKIRELPPIPVDRIPLVSQSGTFYVDRLGVLQDFCCSPENNADTCGYRDTKRLYTLHIPEGVTVLRQMAFREYTVLTSLTLPESLRLMGTGDGCVFADCSLPDVVLGESLEILGIFAFGCSCLRSLRLPKNRIWDYARQFKSGSIGTLYLHETFRKDSPQQKWEYPFDDPGYLRSLKVNNVSIKEIVWWEEKDLDMTEEIKDSLPFSGEEQRITEAVGSYVTEEMKENDPAHDGRHALRVVRLTRLLCQKYPEANPFRAELLAWLHDMHDDKLKSHHGKASLEAFLLSVGVGAEDARFVLEGLPYISYRKHPRLGDEVALEIRIVQDADRIDAMGAVGIGRTFAYGGQKQRSLEESIRHFEEKLLLLYDLLSTEEAKALAKPRYEFLKAFYHQFREEFYG